MRARAAHVEPLQRAAIVAVAKHRPRREQLVERERAVKDVAADQAELTLQIGGREDLARNPAPTERRRMPIDPRRHQARYLVLLPLPQATGSEFRICTLA